MPAARAASSKPLGWSDRLAQQRHIVAKHRAKAAGLEKIALHVDDHQGGMRWIEIEVIRLCLDHRHDGSSPLR